MGRARTVHTDLPRGMYARVRRYATYFVYRGQDRKEHSLGTDYVDALRKWADLQGGDAPAEVAAQVITVRAIAVKYVASEAFKAKAQRTRNDQLAELFGPKDKGLAQGTGHLLAFFDRPPAPLDVIEPHHIARYRDWRKSTHSTQEIALFSAMWNWAREQGYTAKPNPCQGVKRNRGTGRDVYVTNTVYSSVYEKADQPTRDAMDLAKLAGQRPGDNLRMRESDIRYVAVNPEKDPPGWDGRVLYVAQGKTKAKLRVRVIGQLAEVIDRILQRKQAPAIVRSEALIVNERGSALSASALDGRFDKARELAGVDPKTFQMRDLRAKAGTDADEAGGRGAAQDLLGHTTPAMTNKYIRHRLGKLVEPAGG